MTTHHELGHIQILEEVIFSSSKERRQKSLRLTTMVKSYNAMKIKIHVTDQNVSSYNINLTMAFLNWAIKTYIWKSGDHRWLAKRRACMIGDVACLQLVLKL